MQNLIIFTDGGARGNPGPAAIGAVIKTETGEVIKNISKLIGSTTNNVAEYTAVITALEYVKNMNKTPVTSIGSIRLFSDSNLIVNQLNGLFKMKNPNLRSLMLKVRILEQEIGIPVKYCHIPREENRHADALVNQAFEETG